MATHPRRLLRRKPSALALGATLSVSLLLAACSSTDDADDAASNTEEDSATEQDHAPELLASHWLETQLTESDGLLENFGEEDWGITLDSLISLAAAETGADAANATLERFADEGEEWIDFGTGQVAKAAYTLAVYGENPEDFFDGRDLTSELTDAITDEGQIGENSSAFDQAYGILALAKTDTEIPEDAATWLSDQQCTEEEEPGNGGYGVPYEDMTECDVADADTTGLVVQALAAVDVDQDAPEIADALDWLNGQVNDEGAIEAFGEESANSTAWAASAFAAFGDDSRDATSAYLADALLTCDDVSDSDALTEDDIGLVPASSADRDAAADNGVDEILDGARFATAQTPIGLTDAGLVDLSADGAEAASPQPTCDN